MLGFNKNKKGDKEKQQIAYYEREIKRMGNPSHPKGKQLINNWKKRIKLLKERLKND